MQGRLRRGGLTRACGSAHMRGVTLVSRGPTKANVLPRGVQKYFRSKKKKKWQQALVLPFVVYCTYEQQPRMADIR